ncbi:Transmembrane protein [Ceratobasidium theobromae]|uniref:Transmembrane protein n=1 Tax=Ceratobasidium theobromae TaxID=1582974 RepID=A0A5N5QUN1_9AGAM|nr:Transmembrane protein [Ceratobasidium theobromae]
MDGRVALLVKQCARHEARLAELEESLRSEIERTASLSADLRASREQLKSQIAHIEAATAKSLPVISDRLTHAHIRAAEARLQIPILTQETKAVDASFAEGHEKARRLAAALSTHTAHWTIKLLHIIRREAPPDRHTVAMATVHAALFLAVLTVARWILTWVGWEILMRYADAKRPHIHQLLNLQPRT